MKILLFLLYPFLLHASWQAGVGTGSYLGAAQLQSQWESETHAHQVQMIYGYTHDQIIRDIHQISLAYLWSPFEARYGVQKWNPVSLGIFTTYTDHPSYYFKSPKRYNNDHYYDVTNLRWGFRVSSQFILTEIQSRNLYFSVDGSLLEKGVIAFFNNPKELDIFKHFWSLGFSLRLEF